MNFSQYFLKMGWQELRIFPLKMLEGIGFKIPKSWYSRIYGMSERQIWTAMQRASLPRGTRMRILARDKYRCVYCHRDNVPLEIDHITPLYEWYNRGLQGNPNGEANLCAACYDCNRDKSKEIYKNPLTG